MTDGHSPDCQYDPRPHIHAKASTLTEGERVLAWYPDDPSGDRVVSSVELDLRQGLRKFTIIRYADGGRSEFREYAEVKIAL